MFAFIYWIKTRRAKSYFSRIPDYIAWGLADIWLANLILTQTGVL
jgi:hypothetical protein